jgi:EthD domain
MKMIIACRRHPGLSRSAFFAHLRHEHWPLLQRYPNVLAHLAGYVQNHALESHTIAAHATPFRLAPDRDSVIEAWFDAPAALRRLAETPEYLAHVRPDEARFNDVSANVMLKARAECCFEADAVGRCKQFDFIVRDAAVPPEAFLAALADDGRRLALDPFYTAHVDRHVHNYQIDANAAAQGFGEGQFDCVRELWASSFAALHSVTPALHREDVDRGRSFTILATEFVMKAPERHRLSGPLA